MSFNYRIEAIWVIGQRKAFCWQRIPEEKNCCYRLPTTSKNDHRKIKQPSKIMSGHPTWIRKRSRFSQFRWTFTLLEHQAIRKCASFKWFIDAINLHRKFNLTFFHDKWVYKARSISFLCFLSTFPLFSVMTGLVGSHC